tara:strand:- start:1037 stop:1834 length:798 start_codon:yes stop_codon:yes gene_type:complete
MKINFLTFYSEGRPHDEGLNLTDRKQGIEKILKGSFDKIIFYTPSRVSKEISDKYVGPIPNSGYWGNVGNQAWKPAIIYEEIKKISDGDVLIYHDINYRKYYKYIEIKKIHRLFPQWLELCGFDFFIPMSVPTMIYETGQQGEPHTQPLEEWCKQYTLKNLSKDYKFSSNFRQCIVNLLVFKKSDVSMDFIKTWLYYCSKEEYMNEMDYGVDTGNYLKDHLPEQSIANLILCNWIVENKHNIPEDYPRLGFINRDITRPIFKKEI